MPDKFCEYCGAAMQLEDLFCPSCGKKPNELQTPMVATLSDGVPAQEESAALQPQPLAQAVAYEQPSTYSPFSQETGQPPVQQTYSYQPPSQNNPFARFSGEMNTGTPQRRTTGRGMVLGGIIAMFVIAAVVTGIVLALHKPDGSTPSAVGTAGTLAVMPSASPDNADMPAALPDVQNVKTDATLAEIVGDWTGEMQFVRMDGYDTLPADELPPDFKEQIAQAMAEPSPVAIEIEDDGNWSLDVDIIQGMQMGSRDYKDFSNNGNPNIIQALQEGCFEVDIDGTEDGATMQLNFSGVVSKMDDGLAIQGVFMLAVKRGDIDAVMEGYYLVRPST